MVENHLPPHRRFLNRGFFNPEELTNHIDGTKQMICGSEVFSEMFAGGVPSAAQDVLDSIDFINHEDHKGPGRQIYWLSMLVYWPEIQKYVEQHWPGSLSSLHGKRFLANVEQQIDAFCLGKTVDTELLQEMRNAMDLYVFEEQMANQTPSLQIDPLAKKKFDKAMLDNECLQESKRMEKRKKILDETRGSITKAKKRPILLHDQYRKRIEEYRQNWHLQSSVRGKVEKQVVVKAYQKFERLDFMARILLIITRIEICQRIRMMGRQTDQGVVLEQWVPTDQQFELEDPDEISQTDLDEDIDL